MGFISKSYDHNCATVFDLQMMAQLGLKVEVLSRTSLQIWIEINDDDMYHHQYPNQIDALTCRQNAIHCGIVRSMAENQLPVLYI